MSTTAKLAKATRKPATNGRTRKPAFASRLDSYKPARPPGQLLVDQILASLKHDDAAALERALHDPLRVSASALSELLAEEGVRVSDSAIKNWRKVNKVSLPVMGAGGKPA